MNTHGAWGAAALTAFMAIATAAVPALAAPADIALLRSYLGKWDGKGQMTGSRSETVKCKLTMSPGNEDKVNYRGKCALAGTNLVVTGTIQYNDAARRYEAVMSSNITFSGVAIGKRRGDAIVFNLKEREKDENGNDLDITAAITLKTAQITVDFGVVFPDSGDTMKASIPFSK